MQSAALPGLLLYIRHPMSPRHVLLHWSIFIRLLSASTKATDATLIVARKNLCRGEWRCGCVSCATRSPPCFKVQRKSTSNPFSVPHCSFGCVEETNQSIPKWIESCCLFMFHKWNKWLGPLEAAFILLRSDRDFYFWTCNAEVDVHK